MLSTKIRHGSLVILVILNSFIFVPSVFSQNAAKSDEQFTGPVVGVSDGDTISVLHMGEAVKIRLAEIDCPEKKQPFGQKAKAFTSDLVFGETVTVRMKSIDRYGRIVAEIILPDGTSVNRELIKEGFAWWYQRYSNDASLGILEDEAREKKRGLWADPHPIPPWNFRRHKN